MAKKNPAQDGTTKVRILRDCVFGLWGEVAEIPTDLVAGGEAAGMVDSNPDAVAYAESVLQDKEGT